MHCSCNEEKEKWIEDYVERETVVARKPVPDAVTAILEELKDMTTAESAVGTTRKPETIFEEILNAIADSLSNFATSDDEQDGEDEDDEEDDTTLGMLSDDEPCGVIRTISKKVQHGMESLSRSR
jgi:hypothetical protein